MTRIAFYAPLKPADHKTASGDRTIARSFVSALEKAGYKVHIGSRLRSRIATPDLAAMTKIRDVAWKEAGNLCYFWRKLSFAERPAAWVTYHLYYKAVDWIGPRVAEALAIPYIVAEASHAPKRANGPWAFNHDGAQAAIEKADKILCLNPADKQSLLDIVPKSRLVDFPPFMNLPRKMIDKEKARNFLIKRHNLNGNEFWLLVVGMMREGDKLASYHLLAEALARKKINRKMALIVVGDGPAWKEVHRSFSNLSFPVIMAGFVPAAELPYYYRAADLMAWPAINEAFGMAILEAQAFGLPIVAGAAGGVPMIVKDGKTGLLAPPGNVKAFAERLTLAMKSDLPRMGQNAERRVKKYHNLDGAAAKLQTILRSFDIYP